jgi:hypothetical protein
MNTDADAVQIPAPAETVQPEAGPSTAPAAADAPVLSKNQQKKAAKRVRVSSTSSA